MTTTPSNIVHMLTVSGGHAHAAVATLLDAARPRRSLGSASVELRLQTVFLRASLRGTRRRESVVNPLRELASHSLSITKIRLR